MTITPFWPSTSVALCDKSSGAQVSCHLTLLYIRPSSLIHTLTHTPRRPSHRPGPHTHTEAWGPAGTISVSAELREHRKHLFSHVYHLSPAPSLLLPPPLPRAETSTVAFVVSSFSLITHGVAHTSARQTSHTLWLKLLQEAIIELKKTFSDTVRCASFLNVQTKTSGTSD